VTGRTARATTARVLRQLRRDHRTVGLLIAIPCILLILMRYEFDDRPEVFQRVGLPLIGIFPMVSMFLVASIAMLRERRSGTLERLMSLPATRFGLLLGYAGAFSAFAVVQAAVVLTVGIGWLGLDLTGPLWLAGLITLANALLGMGLGLGLSAFAATEFQAVQFMPAFLLPQFLLCGLLVDRHDMVRPLTIVSEVLPLTFAYDALHRVAADPGVSHTVVIDLLVLVAMMLGSLAVGSLTLRRRTP
jgi:ABC-2 type transport system permease protein